MGRIQSCRACQLYNNGGKSRIAIPHTCGKGNRNPTFEQWKKEVIGYLKMRTPAGEDWEWILAEHEDMKRDGYDKGDSPADYVETQIDDGTR